MEMDAETKAKYVKDAAAHSKFLVEKVVDPVFRMAFDMAFIHGAKHGRDDVFGTTFAGEVNVPVSDEMFEKIQAMTTSPVEELANTERWQCELCEHMNFTPMECCSECGMARQYTSPPEDIDVGKATCIDPLGCLNVLADRGFTSPSGDLRDSVDWKLISNWVYAQVQQNWCRQKQAMDEHKDLETREEVGC